MCLYAKKVDKRHDQIIKERAATATKIPESKNESWKYNYDFPSSEPAAKADEPELRLRPQTIKLRAITDEERDALIEANPTAKRTRSLTGVVVKVVGARYRTPTAKAIYCTLKVGDPVSLQLDPHNEEDETAVKVMARYNCIGYVPSEYSNVIYNYTWLKKFYKCYVIEPSPGESLRGLEIALFLKPEEECEEENEEFEEYDSEE
ncbi:HIRAN domain-containing protein [Paramuribaculum intestinale]|uniref:HIRAN domain-containing protein n=1 Tax=Paramuribaculum intestinale TaxID=2094151 RepID=UPI003F691902